jgi:hypothetical protein
MRPNTPTIIPNNLKFDIVFNLYEIAYGNAEHPVPLHVE